MYTTALHTKRQMVFGKQRGHWPYFWRVWRTGRTGNVIEMEFGIAFSEGAAGAAYQDAVERQEKKAAGS